MSHREDLKAEKLRGTRLFLGSNLGTEVTATAEEINKAADLSANGGLVRVAKVTLTAVGGTDETETGITLPANCIVLDVALKVTTAEATATTKTVDIGTDGSGSNDPDGFAVGLSTAATGFARPGPTITTGSNETYFASTTRGALIAPTFLAGTDLATDVGTYFEAPDYTSGGEKVTITAGEAQTEFAGELLVTYIELP